MSHPFFPSFRFWQSSTFAHALQYRLDSPRVAAQRGPRFQFLQPANPVTWLSYTSLMHLREELGRQEDAEGAQATIILVLDERFCGHLPSLIERECPGFHLVITSLNGRLPGLATIGDLDAASNALGWQQITFERDAEHVVAEVSESLGPNEPLLVFWPAWREAPLSAMC